MIEALQADLAANGIRADVGIGDAMAPDVANASFDVVVSSLVLFFLPDPAVALEAWRDLLVPEGRIGVSTFGAQSERWRRVDAVFTPYLPKQLLDARASGTTGPFATDAGMEGLLSAAGFVDVRTSSSTVTARFRDVAHWAEWSWSHGQRVMWEMVPEDERADVRARAEEVLLEGRDADKIGLDQEVRFTTGRRADPGAS